MSSSSAEATSAQVDSAPNSPRHNSQGGSNSATTSNISDLTAERNNSDTISKTVRIDQYGDLKLIVGTDKVCFLVCSRALARSAAFWKTLLYGPFAEAKPADGNEWRVKLPEDHPGALEVILNIVHWPGHPEKIAAIDLDLAFEVAVLTNKYSMTQCLAVCARNWLDVLVPTPEVDFEDDEHLWAPPVQWLFLAHEFGDLTQYLTAYTKLAIRCTYRASWSPTGTTKKLMHYNPTEGDYQPVLGLNNNVSAAGQVVIANLVGEINCARLSAIQMIKSILCNDLAKLRKAAEQHRYGGHLYELASVTPKTICQARQTMWERKCDCDFSMLGLAASEQGRGQWVLARKPEDEHDSVHWFCRDITDEIEAFNDYLSFVRGQGHKHCTPFTTDVPSMEELERYVTELAKAKSAYIRRQAVLSGVQRGESAGGSHKRTHQQMEQNSG